MQSENSIEKNLKIEDWSKVKLKNFKIKDYFVKNAWNLRIQLKKPRGEIAKNLKDYNLLKALF